jgi:H+-transporting ATPase
MADPQPTLEQWLQQLNTTGEGLSGSEAAQRLQRHGPNTLPETKKGRLALLLSYLWGPMPWMIEAAVLLCAVVGDWLDFAIILALLVGNTAIAYVEASAAGDAALFRQTPARQLGLRPGVVPHLRCGEVAALSPA